LALHNHFHIRNATAQQLTCAISRRCRVDDNLNTREKGKDWVQFTKVPLAQLGALDDCLETHPTTPGLTLIFDLISSRNFKNSAQNNVSQSLLPDRQLM
jgi:hypothetical protein